VRLWVSLSLHFLPIICQSQMDAVWQQSTPTYLLDRQLLPGNGPLVRKVHRAAPHTIRDGQCLVKFT
jgi:hypothetical protein